jgi:hypothetical protein
MIIPLILLWVSMAIIYMWLFTRDGTTQADVETFIIISLYSMYIIHVLELMVVALTTIFIIWFYAVILGGRDRSKIIGILQVSLVYTVLQHAIIH